MKEDKKIKLSVGLTEQDKKIVLDDLKDFKYELDNILGVWVCYVGKSEIALTITAKSFYNTDLVHFTARGYKFSMIDGSKVYPQVFLLKKVDRTK
jgi:hypothetical protein